MEFEIGDRVKIKSRDVIGFVVEHTKDNTTGNQYYTIESETEMELENPRDPNVYPAPYPLFDCPPDDLEPI